MKSSNGNRWASRLSICQRADLAALIVQIKGGHMSIHAASKSSGISYATLWRAARAAGCKSDGRKVLKLSQRQAMEAANMHAAGLSKAAIARKFGVGTYAVRSAIKSGEPGKSATSIGPRT